MAACNVAGAETWYRWIDEHGTTRVTRTQPDLGVAYDPVEMPDPVRWRSPPEMPTEVQAVDGSTAPNVFKSASQSVYWILGKLSNGAGDTGQRVYGSAVAITEELALTNCHVIANAGEEIYLGSGSTEAGEQLSVVAANYEADRCVVGVRHMRLRPVAGIRRVDTLEVGETVYAIGNPRRMERTLSDGLLSGKRAMGDLRFLQTTAPISPGSSGGGLFDRRGNLIGITAMTLRGAQNINFAIPAEDFWR
jgi:S1-C subfamily serine protease